MKGKYTPAGLDIDATLELVPPFVYEKAKVKATFNSGKLGLKIEKTKFKHVTFEGLDVTVEMPEIRMAGYESPSIPRDLATSRRVRP